MAAEPLADLPQEARRVLDAAKAGGVLVRAVGGLAIHLRCPSARVPPLARAYKDVDLVGKVGEAKVITGLLTGLGYQSDPEFNSLHGHQRLYFWDPVNQRDLDVFMERITMCHDLDLGQRLALDEDTLPLADLLLTKLQVIEINERDLKDAAALLADHPITAGGLDPDRIAGLLGSDWGWWRTATETLDKVVAYASSVQEFPLAQVVKDRADELHECIDRHPKSLKWKLRARVGDRVKWYVLPEEIKS